MSATPPGERLLPLREGMFEMPDSIDGKPRLYAQRCTSCGEVFYTTHRAFCANCSRPTLEEARLGTTGTVHTYTVVHQPLRGSLMETPYVIAQVRMPEGVLVQTVMADIAPAEMKIGMPVEICLREVDRNDEGAPLVTFFFKPAA